MSKRVTEQIKFSDIQWRRKPGHKSYLDEVMSVVEQRNNTIDHTRMSFTNRLRCEQKMARSELRSHSVAVGNHC